MGSLEKKIKDIKTVRATNMPPPPPPPNQYGDRAGINSSLEKPINIAIVLNNGEVIKTSTNKDLIQLTKDIEMNNYIVTDDKIVKSELIRYVTANNK